MGYLALYIYDESLSSSMVELLQLLHERGRRFNSYLRMLGLLSLRSDGSVAKGAIAYFFISMECKVPGKNLCGIDLVVPSSRRAG